MFPDLGSRFGLVSNFRVQGLGSGVFVKFSKGSWDCTGHYGKSLSDGGGEGRKKKQNVTRGKTTLFQRRGEGEGPEKKGANVIRGKTALAQNYRAFSSISLALSQRFGLYHSTENDYSY